MNESTFESSLSTSLIILRLRGSVYGLRGAKATLEELTKAQARTASFVPSLEFGWSSPRKLWYATTVSLNFLRTGFAPPAPAVFNHLQNCQLTLRSCDGETHGWIKVNDKGHSWGYRKALISKGADVGDFFAMQIDLSSNEALFAVGSEDLIEIAKKGQLTISTIEDDEPEDPNDSKDT